MASQGGHFAGSVLCWLFLEKTYSRWGKAVPPIPAENQFQSAQTPPTTVLVKRGSTGEHVFSACRANKFDGEGPPQKRCYHLSSLACPGKVFLLHPRILTGPRHALDRVRRLDHLNPAPLSSQEHSLAVHEALRLRQCLDFFCVFFESKSVSTVLLFEFESISIILGLASGLNQVFWVDQFETFVPSRPSRSYKKMCQVQGHRKRRGELAAKEYNSYASFSNISSPSWSHHLHGSLLDLLTLLNIFLHQGGSKPEAVLQMRSNKCLAKGE